MNGPSPLAQSFPHFSQSAHQNERGQHPDLSLKKDGSRWWLTRGGWIDLGFRKVEVSMLSSTFIPYTGTYGQKLMFMPLFGLAVSVMEGKPSRPKVTPPFLPFAPKFIPSRDDGKRDRQRERDGYCCFWLRMLILPQ